MSRRRSTRYTVVPRSLASRSSREFSATKWLTSAMCTPISARPVPSSRKRTESTSSTSVQPGGSMLHARSERQSRRRASSSAGTVHAVPSFGSSASAPGPKGSSRTRFSARSAASSAAMSPSAPRTRTTWPSGWRVPASQPSNRTRKRCPIKEDGCRVRSRIFGRRRSIGIASADWRFPSPYSRSSSSSSRARQHTHSCSERWRMPITAPVGSATTAGETRRVLLVEEAEEEFESSFSSSSASSSSGSAASSHTRSPPRAFHWARGSKRTTTRSPCTALLRSSRDGTKTSPKPFVRPFPPPLSPSAASASAPAPPAAGRTTASSGRCLLTSRMPSMSSPESIPARICSGVRCTAELIPPPLADSPGGRDEGEAVVVAASCKVAASAAASGAAYRAKKAGPLRTTTPSGTRTPSPSSAARWSDTTTTSGGAVGLLAYQPAVASSGGTPAEASARTACECSSENKNAARVGPSLYNARTRTLRRWFPLSWTARAADKHRTIAAPTSRSPRVSSSGSR
mmetsp:Transcript_1540/g.5656  ORF Transcript_1540/g.5656 Transcript_1540/m.5656 type:complete len:515 (-) Transcript_1540:244-1788(-)